MHRRFDPIIEKTFSRHTTTDSENYQIKKPYLDLSKHHILLLFPLPKKATLLPGWGSPGVGPPGRVGHQANHRQLRVQGVTQPKDEIKQNTQVY